MEISSENEEEQQQQDPGRSVGNLDPSGFFQCTKSIPSNGKNKAAKNCTWLCRKCKKPDIIDDNRRAHIISNHPDLVGEYNTKAPPRVRIQKKEKNTPNTQPTVGDMLRAGGATTRGSMSVAVTARELNRAIVLFLCVLKLAFRTVDLPVFRSLIMTAIAFGRTHASAKYTVHSRRVLVDEDLEDTLVDTVDETVSIFGDSAQRYGAWLCADGATDVNGVSLEVLMIQTHCFPMLYCTLHPHASSKTGAWLAEQIGAALDGKVNSVTMQHRSESQTEEEEEEIAPAPAKKLKARAPPTTDAISSLHALGSTVWCVVTDNCPTALNATELLRVERGLVPCGDMSHAFSKTYRHILEIPEIKTSMGSAITICDFFLANTKARALLQQLSGKRLRRLVPTRFVTGHAMVERLVFLKPDLKKVLEDAEYFDWLRKQSLSLKVKAHKVAELMLDEELWTQLSFILELGVGFVVAVRLFDGDKIGSACLVHQTWGSLCRATVRVFQKSKDKSFVTESMYNAVKNRMLADWTKFHYPVFAAAMFGTLQFRTQMEMESLKAKDWDHFDGLKSQALDVFVTVLRRFDPDTMELRTPPLAENDASLLDLRFRLETELDDFVHCSGKYAGFPFHSYANMSPADFWVQKSKGGLLRFVMSKVTSLAPSTCCVEREHKLFKATRTKYRSLLGYQRAFGANFIASRYRTESLVASLDWSEINRFDSIFVKLGDADKEFLTGLETEAEKQLEERRLIQEEEGCDEFGSMVELTSSFATAFSLDEVPAVDAEEAMVAEEAAVPPRLMECRAATVPSTAFPTFATL